VELLSSKAVSQRHHTSVLQARYTRLPDLLTQRFMAHFETVHADLKLCVLVTKRMQHLQPSCS